MSAADWQRAFDLADHAERGRLIREAPAELGDADYWRALAEAWQDSERQTLSAADWRALLDAARQDRHLLMTDAERGALDALPDRVAVYRGVNSCNAVGGMSWTLSREVAREFATRHAAAAWSGAIISGRVLRHRVIALFDERTERELLIFPRHVYGRTWAPIGPE